MNDDKTKDPITEAVEAVRKEAFAEGYRAGLAAASNALSDLSEGAPVVTASHVSAKQADGAPTVGTAPYYVWQAVLKKPGMTNSELISAVKGDVPKASVGSIRVSINRVKHKRLIVSRHGKWFPQGA